MTEKSTSGGGMIPIEAWEKIVSAFSGSGGGLVPLPHIHEIFLIDCRIAGTTHVEDIDDKTADIDKGTLLMFRREKDNQYDNLAIQILNSKKERIGYPHSRGREAARRRGCPR